MANSLTLQILFRHILTCKHVELQLCETWLDQQSTKGLNLGRAMARSYSLRQRMLHFVQNLVYYVTVEVTWHATAWVLWIGVFDRL